MFKQLHDGYKLSFEAIGKKIGKGYDFVEARYHMFMKLSPVVKTLLTEIRSTENGMNYGKARELVSLNPMMINRYRKQLESDGVIEPQEKKLGLDNREINTVEISTITNVTVNPFEG